MTWLAEIRVFEIAKMYFLALWLLSAAAAADKSVAHVSKDTGAL